MIRRPSSSGRGSPDRRADTVEERRSVRSDIVAAGTLACRRCDAPVYTGGRPLALTDTLACPFCAHRAPAREFLSLARPTRPAHVVVRVSLGR